MISLIFLSLAAICNAVMDVCKFHWHKSIFTKRYFKRIWWDGTISHLNKYVDRDFNNERVKWRVKVRFLGLKIDFEFNKPVQLTDAWHLFKMLMLVFVLLAIVFYNPVYKDILNHIGGYKAMYYKLYIQFHYPPLCYAVDFFLYGYTWILVFNLFFRRVLKLDNNK